MRFKLRHLFVLLLIIAISLAVFERYTRSTAVVEFSDAKLTLNQYDEPIGFTILFQTQKRHSTVYGSAADTLGYSQMFRSSISKSNLPQLNGRKIKVSYRKHQLLWLPAISIPEAINSRFRYEIIWREGWREGR